jgi:NAD(P)-dependent dehydrogenase (short-subunit alcohol dehydrogenase family)
MPSISGAAILVLGGSSGIGFAVAEKCLTEGARVFISSSNSGRIARAVGALQVTVPNGQVSGHLCDLSHDDVESRLDRLFAEIGQLDHIVFTAADSLAIKPLQDVDLDYIKRSGHIRFFVPLLVAKVGSRFLKQ